MTTKLSEVWPAVTLVARENGVAHIGASDLRDEHASVFAQWIADGHHATMRYLEKNVAIRRDPAQRFPWAKSVIAILVPYSSERPHDGLAAHVARYALGDDYHDVLDRILREIEKVIQQASVLGPRSSVLGFPPPHPLMGATEDRGPRTEDCKTWRYVDTGPLSDRSAAAQAGLGWIGKNGVLIHEEHGSYFFIGTLLTSLENDIAAHEVADRCGACTRCIDACPTDAILPNRTVASERCISYATIEHRGPLTEDLDLAGNAFGCDICQEVCPWNGAPLEPHPAFAPRDAYRATPVTDLLRFGQTDFSRLFAKSAVKRAKLDGMKRNVEAITAGRG